MHRPAPTRTGTSSLRLLEGTGYTNLEYGVPDGRGLLRIDERCGVYEWPVRRAYAFIGASSYDYMQGTGYKNLVYSFPTVVATAASASDTVYLYGPSTARTPITPNRIMPTCKGPATLTWWNRIHGDRHFGLGQRHGLSVWPLDRQQYVRGQVDADVPARTGYTNVANNFTTVIGVSASTSDTAYLYGPSTGSNTFVARPTQAYLQGSGYMNVADTFPNVLGISSSASDTAYLYGAATGSNTFVATSTYAYLQGSGYMNVANSFTTVLGISASTSDTADLDGPSTGSNTFVGGATQSYMQGTGYEIVAVGFQTVVAVSVSTSDTATLNASTGAPNTLLAGTPYTAARDQAIMEYPTSSVEVEDFPEVIARTTRAATDPADTADVGIPTTCWKLPDCGLSTASANTPVGT